MSNTDSGVEDVIGKPFTSAGDGQNFNALFEKKVDIINVLDIYNIASSVGQEFERLTDAFGGAVFAGVMPKIIRILEMLEAFVKIRDEKTTEITNMGSIVDDLQHQSLKKDEKQEEEIGVIESCWKDETKVLQETIAVLENDNKKLAELLENKMEEVNANIVEYNSKQQRATMSKLQAKISEQRDELRVKSRAHDELIKEFEAVHSQMQRYAKHNSELHSKMKLLEHQGKLLIAEKAELEAKMLNKTEKSVQLQMSSIPKSPDRVEPPTSFPGNKSSVEKDVPMDPLLANKLVIDLTDPDRPRYTLQELQEVLNDRNQLKAENFLLKEELVFYKDVARKYGYDEQRDSWEELNQDEINESMKMTKLQAKRKAALNQRGKDDANNTSTPPQQQNESGIRKFFTYLTGGGGSTQKQPNDVKTEASNSSAASKTGAARIQRSQSYCVTDTPCNETTLINSKTVSDLAAAITPTHSSTRGKEMKVMAESHQEINDPSLEVELIE